ERTQARARLASIHARRGAGGVRSGWANWRLLALSSTHDCLTTGRIAFRVRDSTRPLRRFFDKASPLSDGLRIIVDLQAQADVVLQPHAATLLYDEHRGALLAARVAACCLTSLERGDESKCERTFRTVVRGQHRVHDTRASEDIALGRDVRALSVAS